MFKKISLFVAVVATTLAVVAVSTSNAQATSSSTCVDGSNKNNLVYKWTGYDKVEVSTKSGKAVCKDVNMYFSAFVMPDTWDKKGFNDTAIPQALHRSVSVKLTAGKPGQKVVASVPMPATCKHVQTDLYYAPEQKVITKTEQIGSRLVTAKHKVGSGECVTVTPPKVNPPKVNPPKVTPPKVTPPKVIDTPVTPVTPETPKAPVQEEVVPAELPRTGTSPVGAAAALLTAAGVYGVVLRLRK